MRLPRVALLVPLLLCGALVPALGAPLKSPPAGVMGMGQEHFAGNRVVIPCGGRLTLQNDSRFVHIIGPGHDGVLSLEAGVPVAHRELMGTNDVVTTAAWTRPGVYHLACAVHPEMNLEVVVTACRSPSARS